MKRHRFRAISKDLLGVATHFTDSHNYI